MKSKKKSYHSIRGERLKNPDPNQCKLVIAHPWPKIAENVGTLVRTAEALNACIATRKSKFAKDNLKIGNTVGLNRTHVHWIGDPISWLGDMRREGYYMLGVELAEGATPLRDLQAAPRRKTVVVLGNEGSGIPETCWDKFDEIVEIPMLGRSHSLNVAVAGSLVAYKVMGLA